MPARRVEDILEAVRSVHRQLAGRYRELDAATTDERIKLLLEDMERRERKFEECVGKYEAEEGPGVLGTWLQFVPEETLHVDRLAERLAQPRSLEELVEETVALNSSLEDAYRAIAQDADAPEIQELFGNLAHLERNNDCHYAKMLLNE